MEKGLLSYSPKVLLALQFSIGGNIKFFQWLTEAGYPELAALSHAIDGDSRSRLWLKSNYHLANTMFVLACRKDDKAISWLKFMKLDILMNLANEVAELRNKQELDASYPYKMRF